MSPVPPEADPAEYAFRDSAAAAARLASVNRMFEPSFRSLLDVAELPTAVELAVDLGCGPGHTTRLLGAVVRPRSLAGLDISSGFLARAGADADAAVPAAWYRHDVTTVPFPTGPADLIHSRWVLAHLRDPLAVLDAWLTQLRPGGVLLVQEDERITTEGPRLAAYQRISDSLVAHHGGDLYVGRQLGRAPLPPGFGRTLDRVHDHRVSAPSAARIFAMNFAVWRADPWIRDQHRPAELDALARDLDRLAGSDDASEIVFSIRQLAISRAPRAG